MTTDKLMVKLLVWLNPLLRNNLISDLDLIDTDDDGGDTIMVYDKNEIPLWITGYPDTYEFTKIKLASGPKTGCIQYDLDTDTFVIRDGRMHHTTLPLTQDTFLDTVRWLLE